MRSGLILRVLMEKYWLRVAAEIPVIVQDRKVHARAYREGAYFRYYNCNLKANKNP